jgi:hypothetical protein
MNDNVYAEGPHHTECLRLLNDLHDLLVWAEAMGIQINSNNESFRYAMDFPFWREQIADVLGLAGKISRREKVA